MATGYDMATMADVASRPSGKRPAPRIGWRVPALFVLVTVLMAYPVSVHPSRGLMGDGPDAHLFMWTLAWDTHAFVHQPLAIFDANIFYPNQRTLAYSENLIGSAFFAAPILWLTNNPVLALNVVSLLTCVLCGIGAYLLGLRLALSPTSALLVGLVFAFSPARFYRLSQLHLTAVQWIPFCLAYLHTYLDDGRKRDLRLAMAFFSLQVLSSGHGAVFLVIAAAALLLYRVALGEPIAWARRVRDVGISGALLLIPLVLTYVPYRRAQTEVGLVRSLDGPWGAVPESFLASPSYVHAWLHSFLRSPHVNTTASAFLFPGYVPLLLALVALWPTGRPTISPAIPRDSNAHGTGRSMLLLEMVTMAVLMAAVALTVYGPIRLRLSSEVVFTARGSGRAWILVAVLTSLRFVLGRKQPLALPRWLRSTARAAARRRDERHGRPPTHRALYAGLVIVSVLLSLGPPVSLWPLVYWLPLFNFIRAPSRFIVLGVLGLAALAGMGLDRVTAGRPRGRGLITALMGGLLIVESVGAVRFDPYRWDIPAIDRWLATQPTPFAVAEVPVSGTERSHSVYMLHSTMHWQKTVHGYSGIVPARHEQLYRQLQRFPDAASIESLSGLKIDYVVVHTDFYSPESWRETEARLKAFSSQLTLIHSEGAGRVYALAKLPTTR